MTPARPPGSDALGETLAYFRDLGVAELYLDGRFEEIEEEKKKISLKVKREAGGAPAGDAAAELQSLAFEVSSCVKCRLCKTRKQTVFADGSSSARIMFIGEAPGADEDAQGVPFVGRAGQLLTRMIEDGMGLPRSSVYIANVLKCRPPENRNPEPDEIASCRGYLERQIDLVKPEVLVALGKFAAHFLLETDEGITRLRGKWGSYRGIPVMPTLHPSYLLRQPAQKKEAWEDLLAVLTRLGIDAPARKGKQP
ncbi:MAG: uracil-DNA glycosylase [Acidobacteriota bacterium]|nr:uracil-DNA glycosylase [Acidobacteriota bacterium]